MALITIHVLILYMSFLDANYQMVFKHFLVSHFVQEAQKMLISMSSVQKEQIFLLDTKYGQLFSV